jgi:hypothetical protein
MLGAVMVLALLVGALGFLVERQAVGRPELDALNRARAAARAAVERALDHVQELAGDDRRVTATMGRTGAIEDGRRGVAGVWDSADAEARFLGWLMDGSSQDLSGSQGLAALPSPIGNVGADDVVVVGLGSVATARERVVARLRPVPSLSAGVDGGVLARRARVRTTYVVFDEGVKASLRTAPELAVPREGVESAGTDGSLGAAAWRWEWARGPQGSGLERLFPGLDGSAPALHARANRVFLRSQVRLLDPAITASRLRNHFHDVTALARAVLASTARERSGLRSDWADMGAIEDPALVGALGLQVPEGGTLLLQPTRVIATGRVAPAAVSLGPTVVEASLWLGGVTSGLHEGGGGFGLRYETRIALWNTASIPRRVEPAELEVVWHGAPRLRITASGHEIYSGALPAAATRAVNLAAVTWAPGEVRLLRGGGQLADLGAPGVAWWPSPPLGSGTVDGVRVQLEDASRDGPLTAVVRVRGEWLGELRAAHGFDAVEESIPPEGVAEGPAWRAAVGAVALGPPDQDPRVPRLIGARPSSAARWNADPIRNASVADEFVRENLPDWAGGVLWDPPATSRPSLTGLRGVLVVSGGSLGSPQGAQLNRLFDEVFFAPAQTERVAALPGSAIPAHPFLELRMPPHGRSVDSSGGAAGFWIRGAFNINSTSVAAWSTVLHAALDTRGLAGLEGLRIPRRDGVEDVRAIEVRSRAAALAHAIVARIRARDLPFCSVAEFANSGLVEDAIHQTELNQGLAPDRRGRPGWLDQADLLVRLGPRLVARSDTFLVRAYAEVQEVLTQRVLARAWCEATLQRVPEAAPGASPPGPVGTGPQKRRFEIIDFRWLLPSEV